MQIAVISGSQATLLRNKEFANEAELERLVAENPALLKGPEDGAWQVVTRQVTLSDAGILDLLMVSEEGLPIAAEVKLFNNGESRREIVAQALDYISALTELTVDELDQACGSHLEHALRSFDSPVESGDSAFERRWAEVGKNLRAGVARVVLVLDKAPPELVRMVRHLAQNSAFDIQLVVIERYLTSADQIQVVVPRVLVSGATEQKHPAIQDRKPPRENLLKVVELYNRSAPPELRASGIAYNYRQIQPREFANRGRIHYEFWTSSSQIGAELHLESASLKPLAEILAPLQGRNLPKAQVALLWDGSFNAGGRLRALFAGEAPPSQVATAMSDLIELTRPLVSERLAVLK